MRTLLAGLLAVASLLAASPAIAQDKGQIGIRLLDAPTNRKDDPRARVYIVDHVPQGQVVTRHVQVTNTTPRALSVDLYPAAASISGGQFTFAPGRTGDELTSWTSVTPSRATVPSGGAVTATVTIAVPAGATSGERYGVIWAQTSSSGSGNVTEVSRVGVRMYLSVGSGSEPPSDFSVTSLQADRATDGSPVVVATIRNTGQRALDIQGSLQLRNGPGGLSAGPYPATVATLGVGQTAPLRLVLPASVPAGPWDGELSMVSGQVRHSVRGQLLFPDKPGTGSTITPHTVGNSEDRPWWHAALAVLAIGLVGANGLFLLLWRRRRRREGDHPVG